MSFGELDTFIYLDEIANLITNVNLFCVEWEHETDKRR